MNLGFSQGYFQSISNIYYLFLNKDYLECFELEFIEFIFIEYIDFETFKDFKGRIDLLYWVDFYKDGGWEIRLVFCYFELFFRCSLDSYVAWCSLFGWRGMLFSCFFGGFIGFGGIVGFLRDQISFSGLIVGSSALYY